jgi:hypothetical protein
MKINISKLHRFFAACLSSFLVLAVFLTSTHAKDIASGSSLRSKVSFTDDASTKKVDDSTVAKSIGDLHSHVDKTMVKDPGMNKSMNKSFGDSSALLARREREEVEEEQSLGVKVIEMMFMARLTLAYALAG